MPAARARLRAVVCTLTMYSACCPRRTLADADVFCRSEMFSTAQKTQELWMWKMEYLHHEQRPLYFGEWF